MTKQAHFSFCRWSLVEQKDMLLTRLSSAQRVAQKQGFPEPRLYWRGTPEPRPLHCADGHEMAALKQKAEFSGHCVVLAEVWQVFARVQHKKAPLGYQNQVVRLPVTPELGFDQKGSARELRVAPPYCAIAGNARRRNVTYWLRHLETGEIIQVSEGKMDGLAGKKTKRCLTAFFDFYAGVLSEETWKAWDASYAAGGRVPLWFPVHVFLAMAERLTQHEGFVKASLPNATRSRIVEAINTPELITDRPLAYYVAHALETERLAGRPEYKKARAIVAHYRAIVAKNEFDARAQDICMKEWLRLDHGAALGVLAALPSTYARQLKTTSSPTLNAYFGVLKARGTLKLKVCRCFPYEGEHLATYYTLMDDQGRTFRWRAASAPREDMSEGAWITLVGTIKQHSDYRGVKQTELTRCTDIVPTTQAMPAPTFTSEVDTRPVKDTWNFSLTERAPSGDIDGHVYWRIERTWKEAGKIRGIETVVPVPDMAHARTCLLEMIKTEGQVTRPNGVCSSVDEAFVAAGEVFLDQVYQARSHVKEWFMVEDAFHGCGDHVAHLEGQGYRGSAGDKHKLDPRLFRCRSDAERHGRQMPVGRMVSFKPSTPLRCLVLSDEARQRDSLQDVLRCATQAGYQVVAFLRENGSVSQYRPLAWSRQKWRDWHFEVTGMWPVHRALDSHQQQLFRQAKFAVLCSADLRLLRRLTRDVPNQLVLPAGEGDARYLLMRPCAPTLSDIAYTEGVGRRHVRQVMVADPVMAYYLAKMGGDVARLDVLNPRVTQASNLECAALSMSLAAFKTQGLQQAFDAVFTALAQDELYFRRAAVSSD
jgi:hypothetical protein